MWLALGSAPSNSGLSKSPPPVLPRLFNNRFHTLILTYISSLGSQVGHCQLNKKMIIYSSDTKSRFSPAPTTPRHRREWMSPQENSPALRIFSLCPGVSRSWLLETNCTSGFLSVTDQTPQQPPHAFREENTPAFPCKPDFDRWM